MTRRYFGTDGIRGRANEFPMTAEMTMKVAMAASVALKKHQDISDHNRSHQNRVVIGKDTRLSGYMFEQAMAAGFLAMGMDVVLLGPIPTPAVAVLTQSLRADLGVMISASHNPFEDNGIKLFGADGFKLHDRLEQDIEDEINKDLDQRGGYFQNLCQSQEPGRASRLEDASGRYVEFIKSLFPRGQTLRGLKVVIDCAHGAAYKVAPQVLWELEADVVTIGHKPNGTNINDGFGATSTDQISSMVLAHNADIGIALDGDADRVILIDEKGQVVDGDQILALLAKNAQSNGTLIGQGIVSTVMSNLGLERYLETIDLTLYRAKVGDRYVVELMREKAINIGGEQSGHIIMTDYGTTGDGLLAALQVLGILQQSNDKASSVLTMFEKCPQILENIAFEGHAQPLENQDVKVAISKAQDMLGNNGRILVRPSGTQSLIRVMGEGDDAQQVQKAVTLICDSIQSFLDKPQSLSDKSQHSSQEKKDQLS